MLRDSLFGIWMFGFWNSFGIWNLLFEIWSMHELDSANSCMLHVLFPDQLFSPETKKKLRHRQGILLTIACDSL